MQQRWHGTAQHALSTTLHHCATLSPLTSHLTCCYRHHHLHHQPVRPLKDEAPVCITRTLRACPPLLRSSQQRTGSQPLHSTMDAAYLQSHVGPLLSAGLTATLTQQPVDPIDFLARWLLHAVDRNTKETQLAQSRLQAADDDQRAEHSNQLAQQQSDTQQREQKEQEAERAAALSSFLAGHTDRCTVFSSFLHLLAPVVSVRGMYAARFDGGADSESLRYIADNDDQLLLAHKLNKADGGVLFDLTAPQEDEAEEEAAEDNQAAAGKQIVPKPLRSMLIPNVLIGPTAQRIKFFKQPRVGSLYAVRVQLPSVRCEESMEDAVEKLKEREERRKEEEEETKKKEQEKEEAGEEEAVEQAEADEEEVDEDDEEAVAARDKRRAEREAAKLAATRVETPEEKAAREEVEKREREEKEERELVASLVKRNIAYAVCFDTLGQNRRLSESEQATLLQWVEQLNGAVQRLDLQGFVEERKSYRAFLTWQLTRTQAEAEKGGAEEEAKADKEKLRATRKAANEPSTPQDVDFAYLTNNLSDIAPGLELLTQTAVLRGGNVGAFQAALHLTGTAAAVCGDWEGKAEWEEVRGRLNEQWWETVKAYRPRDDEDEARMKRVKQWLAGVDEEKVRERNAVTAAVLAWVRAVLAVRARVHRERRQEKERKEREERERREKEEEEERKRKEAEEEAAAAAEEQGEEAEEEEEES